MLFYYLIESQIPWQDPTPIKETLIIHQRRVIKQVIIIIFILSWLIDTDFKWGETERFLIKTTLNFYFFFFMWLPPQQCWLQPFINSRAKCLLHDWTQADFLWRMSLKGLGKRDISTSYRSFQLFHLFKVLLERLLHPCCLMACGSCYGNMLSVVSSSEVTQRWRLRLLIDKHLLSDLLQVSKQPWVENRRTGASAHSHAVRWDTSRPATPSRCCDTTATVAA